jgi:hypothetical protein
MAWAFSIHIKCCRTKLYGAFTMKNQRYFLPALLLLLSGMGGQKLSAQSIKLMRYDEDYSNLKDSARGFYNRLKFVPLSANGKTYFTFGGELRYEYAGKQNEDWIKGEGYNHSYLQRYVLYADLHTGNHLRFFVQANSALENGSKYGPSPVDEDRLAIQNLFGEVKAWQANGKSLIVRLGRQELNYGSGRLISVREGTAVRQYFTGGKIMYTSKNFNIDGFVMAADKVNPGVFDNEPSHQANLWGTYATLNIAEGGNFDFYYLGIRRDNAEFEEGINKELRHTIATRYWKYGGGFIYNLEAAYQFGKFGTGNINAWTAAVDIGYMFENVKFKPSINLRNDYISGDRKAGDGSLQTFNPLYPKGGYFGFNPLIGPSNLIDLHPYGALTLSDKLSVQADLVYNWRYSLADGIYRPSGNFNTAGSASVKRYIGTTYLLSADYRYNAHLSISCGAQYFKTGGFINDIVNPPSNSTFFNTQIAYKF